MAQLLSVTHALASKSAADARQAQGTLLGQSASLLHVSYEQTLMQAMGPPLMQRPFFPAVQSESCQHLGDRPSPASGEHPSRLGSPDPRACGQRALIGRCCSGARFVPASVLPASGVPLPPSAPSEPPDLSSLWSHASARGKARRNAILALLMGTGVGKLQASCPRLHPWARQGSCQFSRSSPWLYRQLSETRPPGFHQIRGYFGLQDTTLLPEVHGRDVFGDDHAVLIHGHEPLLPRDLQLFEDGHDVGEVAHAIL